MPYVLAAAAGGIAALWASNAADDYVKYALAAGAIYVAGKYVKAW